MVFSSAYRPHLLDRQYHWYSEGILINHVGEMLLFVKEDAVGSVFAGVTEQ